MHGYIFSKYEDQSERLGQQTPENLHSRDGQGKRTAEEDSEESRAISIEYKPSSFSSPHSSVSAGHLLGLLLSF